MYPPPEVIVLYRGMDFFLAGFAVGEYFHLVAEFQKAGDLVQDEGFR